jgi:hypothetical protein
LDREYLEDYEQREREQYERFLKAIRKDRINFETGRYPPDERFIKLQKPVTLAAVDPNMEYSNAKDIWAQVPFSGSLVLPIPSFSPFDFERFVFKTSEVPKVVDFIKETGRFQIAFLDNPTSYEGLDYLDPVFRELSPPVYRGFPFSTFVDKREEGKARATFFTLGKIGFLRFFREQCELATAYSPRNILSSYLDTYTILKLCHYEIVEEIENLMVDKPSQAHILLYIASLFITEPLLNIRCNVKNFTLNQTKQSQILPYGYHPKEIRFPCEIGNFLMKKLTYAPQGLRACNELIDHYDAYDLQGVQKSLNEAIVSNNPDIVYKSSNELSEILANVWSDKTIPRRVKDLQIGIPLFLAAIGGVAAGPIGATGGFLAGLGYNVVEKTIDLNTEGLSERLAKLKTKSYQANIYDFKKKYKNRIVKE